MVYELFTSLAVMMHSLTDNTLLVPWDDVTVSANSGARSLQLHAIYDAQ